MATLKVNSGPSAGQAVEVDRSVVVGREDADLVLPDSEVSRNHAALRPTDDGIEIEDLGSMNGTFVNGERISAVTRVTADATIRLGQTMLGVEIPPPALAPPTPDVTAPHAIPGIDLTAPRKIPDPDVTAPRNIPTPDVTAPRQVPVTPPADHSAPAASPSEAASSRPRPALIVGVVVALLLLVILLVLLFG